MWPERKLEVDGWDYAEEMKPKAPAPKVSPGSNSEGMSALERLKLAMAQQDPNADVNAYEAMRNAQLADYLRAQNQLSPQYMQGLQGLQGLQQQQLGSVLGGAWLWGPI